MKTTDIDITDLLINKPFDALSYTERKLVLNELGSEENYNVLRREILDYRENEDAVPPDALRSNVMSAFDRFHKKEHKTFGLWRQDRSWYRQPVTIALATAAVLLIVFLVIPFQNGSPTSTQLAEQKTSKKVEVKIPVEESDSINETVKKPAIQDDLTKKELKRSFDQSQETKDETLQEDKSEWNKSANLEDSESKTEEQTIETPEMKLLQETEPSKTTDSFASPQPEAVASNYLGQEKTKALKKEKNRSQELSNKQQYAIANENVTADALPAESDKSKASVFQVRIPLPDHYISY